jgi:hypothetical protein
MGNLASDSYQAIKQLEGNKIRRVVYYYWKNLISDDEFKSLDWVEIKLHDDTIITFHYGVDDDGIEVVDFNFEKELDKVEAQFQGQITLIRDNATLDKHWFPVLDTPIKNISFPKIGGNYQNSKIIFEFTDDHKVEIAIQEEGMEVEFFE